MAQNFRNQVARNTGTSPADILTQADSFDTVIGIRLTNVAASAINVDVYIVSHQPITILSNQPLSLSVAHLS